MQAHITNRVDSVKYRSYHLTRALSLCELKKISAKKISCSPSTYLRLSKKAKEHINKNKIIVKIEKHKGKPLQINPKKILCTIKLYKTGKSYRDISRETGIPKSTIHYLVKKAKRTKIKKGKTILSV